MTDEERQKLIEDLKWLNKLDYEPEIAVPCGKAADEIKRLVAFAQSDAEPVAWLVKHADGFDGFTFTTANEAAAQAYAQKHQQYSVSPLYTAPPRPDASRSLCADRSGK